jgi:hypothetical protein
MIAKKPFIINKASDILVRWGRKITSGIRRMIVAADGKGGATRYESVVNSRGPGQFKIPG